jgi:hypothetical protein
MSIRKHTNLLPIATHKHRELQRHLLDYVALRVFQSADVSVLLVRAKEGRAYLQ